MLLTITSPGAPSPELIHSNAAFVPSCTNRTLFRVTLPGVIPPVSITSELTPASAATTSANSTSPPFASPSVSISRCAAPFVPSMSVKPSTSTLPPEAASPTPVLIDRTDPPSTNNCPAVKTTWPPSVVMSAASVMSVSACPVIRNSLPSVPLSAVLSVPLILTLAPPSAITSTSWSKLRFAPANVMFPVCPDCPNVIPPVKPAPMLATEASSKLMPPPAPAPLDPVPIPIAVPAVVP